MVGFTYITCPHSKYMPEATPAGGGYTCQVCGETYATKQQLIEHGREQHPGKPVTWGDPIEPTLTSDREYDTAGRAETRVESEVKSDIGGVGDKVKDGAEAVGSKVTSNVEGIRDKMKAGAKAMGSKLKDPNRDLETEYQKKKEE
jgi:hypothetical protein